MELTFLFLLSCLQLLLLQSASHPLCTDSKAPFIPQTPLDFCPYNGSVCCDSNKDLALREVFEAMNISNPACASLYKSILCATCDQFSASLYKIESGARRVPVLCTVSANSTLSNEATDDDFCSEVWNTCQNVSISNSPFAGSLDGRTGARLMDIWQSESSFCKEFGGSTDDGEICFNGKSAVLSSTDTLPPQLNSICLEKVANGSYLDVAAHPDGSNRVFLANIHGKIWLTAVPEEGSGDEMLIDESNPFLDITDIVYVESELGLLSIAFHPNFAQNGRFFASYNCDRFQWSGCYGRCSCNTDVNCDPSKLSLRNGARPCQYHSVISEFTANGSSLSDPSLVMRANPTEVRRIFTMGLAYTTFHGGQILFGPDGYLYVMTGNNEARTDPHNFAQQKKSLLGKILRFDIDKMPSAKEISKSHRWGNYSIPSDNPHYDDKEFLPEIWSLGLSNPWRCSFDSERPSYFLCGDCGQDTYEEVNLITKGGNYGWRDFEGTAVGHPPNSTKRSVKNYIAPVMGYEHSGVNADEGSAAITGGYFYRSKTDPCMYGRYLYADLYGTGVWAGTESPENSGNFTTSEISFGCAHDSPLHCNLGAEESSLPSLGYLFSMGTDNNKDVFLLTSKGILRVVRPSRCNHTCPLEDITDYRNSGHVSPSRSCRSVPQTKLLMLFSSLVLLLLYDFIVVKL